MSNDFSKQQNEEIIIMVRVLIVLSVIFFCRCTLLYSVTDMLMILNFTEGCSHRSIAKSSNLICICNFIRCNHKCSSMSNSSTIGKDECALKLMLLREACLQSKGHKTHHYQTWPLWRPIHPLANLSYGSNQRFHILHDITWPFLRMLLKCLSVLLIVFSFQSRFPLVPGLNYKVPKEVFHMDAIEEPCSSLKKEHSKKNHFFLAKNHSQFLNI